MMISNFARNNIEKYRNAASIERANLAKSDKVPINI